MSLREASLLPDGCAVARRLLAPARAETPPAATEQGRPTVGPLAVRMKPRQRYPAAGRPLGDPQPPEAWPLAPAGRIGYPPPKHCALACGRVVVKPAPRATGAIAPKRAGTERADRRVETWAAEGRTTRVRAASSTARSHATAGRSCGLDGRSERPLKARGAKENLHGVARKDRPRTRRARKSLHGVARKDRPRTRRATKSLTQ